MGQRQGEGVQRQHACLAVQEVLQGGKVLLLQLLLPASAASKAIVSKVERGIRSTSRTDSQFYQ